MNDLQAVLFDLDGAADALASELRAAGITPLTASRPVTADTLRAQADAAGVPAGLCALVSTDAAAVDAAQTAGLWTIGVGPSDKVGRAHVRLDSLDGVDVAGLRDALQVAAWSIREHEIDPVEVLHMETVYTIGNGNFCVRGSFEEGDPRQNPATFMHRVWDDMPVSVTELANLPVWTGLDLWIDGRRVRLTEGLTTDYERALDLRTGVLWRGFTWRADAAAPAVRFTFTRFVDLTDPHSAVVRLTAEAVDGAATLRVRAGLDAHVENTGLIHLDVVEQSSDADGASLLVRTRTTKTQVGVAARVTVSSGAQGRGTDAEGAPAVEHELALAAGAPVTLTKFVAIVPDLDADAPFAVAQAKASGLAAKGWAGVRAAHDAAWAEVWDGCDVEIDGDPEAQLALRYNMFQLVIAAPRYTDKASIGAKTLSGFGYRHHAFWDTESFMLPMFSYTHPELARNMLMYRYHGLVGAREKAAGNGYAGAQFPWESASDGSEVTPTWVPHFADRTKLIRIWTGDIEIHITADVALGVLDYWKITGDDAFMRDFGAEIVLDGATFWATAAKLEDDGLYHYRNVIGPDEYHDQIDDNAYTNYLAVWHLNTAAEVLAWLRANHADKAAELTASLGLDDARLASWKTVAGNMLLPLDPETGLIEQFEGYFNCEEVPQSLMRDPKRDTSIQQLYGIEEACATQCLKQPDVLMLQYLRPELFTEAQLQVNYAYYDPRTDHEHGSSLGPSISAVMACRAGHPEEGYEHFLRAARADLLDVRHNAGDGIHGASAGGMWQATVFGFAGLVVTEDGYTTNPMLPASWTRLAFTFSRRGVRERVVVER